jgi:hypothetical protein
MTVQRGQNHVNPIPFHPSSPTSRPTSRPIPFRPVPSHPSIPPGPPGIPGFRGYWDGTGRNRDIAGWNGMLWTVCNSEGSRGTGWDILPFHPANGLVYYRIKLRGISVIPSLSLSHPARPSKRFGSVNDGVSAGTLKGNPG